MRLRQSLRARLLLWLLIPLSVFVAVCAWLSWRNAATVADYVQDHDLLSSAKVLSDRLIWDDSDVQASIPPSALSLFVSPAHDRVFLSVLGSQGELLAGNAGFPLPSRLNLSGSDRAQWYDAKFNGSPVRAVVTRRSMYDVAGSREITIAVGKTTRSRDQMLMTLWRPTVEYLLIALLLAGLLSVIALTWELRPIDRLNRQLDQGDPLRLDYTLDARGLHQELRPVVDTVNRFALRLREHAQAQRRFIADAAHQLRTPLALQATQIEYVLYTRRHRGEEWTTRRADMDEMWRQMLTTNQRLVDVTNKLLLLAQAEHSEVQTSTETIDLAATVRGCVEQLAGLADRRRIDLGVELPDSNSNEPGIWLKTHPALLDALVSNLIDNALRYTPEGGRVTVAMRQEKDNTLLTVEDNGPGIAPELRERVFARFFRAAPETQGSGLGLSIVREVARVLNATVQLSDAQSHEPRGLLVTVSFPQKKAQGVPGLLVSNQTT